MPAKRSKISRSCEICGKGFYPYDTTRADRGRFCSFACAGISNKKYQNKNCLKCDKEFYSNEHNGIAKYCSYKCSEDRRRPRGPQHHSWKGGRGITSHGYVSVSQPHHPNADSKGRVLEHRLVMERLLGRYLYSFENVHHRNGVRSDNSPGNLELWTKPQCKGQRPIDLAEWAVKNYRTEVEIWLGLIQPQRTERGPALDGDVREAGPGSVSEV